MQISKLSDNLWYLYSLLFFMFAFVFFEGRVLLLFLWWASLRAGSGGGFVCRREGELSFVVGFRFCIFFSLLFEIASDACERRHYTAGQYYLFFVSGSLHSSTERA